LSMSPPTTRDMRPYWQRLLLNYWYNNRPLFLPLRLLVHALEKITSWWVKRQPAVIREQDGALPPVVVVGNFIVGGAGKTPVVRHLVDKLKAKGFKPGVISRGYGRSASDIGIFSPGQSDSASLASRIGDEPAWLAQALDCPIAVGAERTAVLKALHDLHPEIDVVVSDDGMQHRALKRVFEIAVCDERGFGNGFLMPAGPLREPMRECNRVDAFVLTNGEWDRRLLSEVSVRKPLYRAQLTFRDWRNVETGERLEPAVGAQRWADKKVIAVAGLANPAKFFRLIDAQGITHETLVVPDHFQYPPDFVQKLDAEVILTTGKDAVKWLNDQRVWIAEVEFDIPDELINAVEDTIRGSENA
jgi:tetraacyldisaccharide 4'-kinase